jgi:hypothetical protein
VVDILSIQPNEIAFDVDGVVADTFRYFVRSARNQYGCAFDYEDITEYDFRKVIDIEDATSEAIIQRALEDPIHCGIEPLPGAVSSLTRLAGKAPLLFVTARPEPDAILAWLLHYLEDVPEGKIRLEATGTGENKPAVLKAYNVAYFVEDCLETGFLLEKAPVTPIIFEQPWNRKPHPFPRVSTWNQLSSMVAW